MTLTQPIDGPPDLKESGLRLRVVRLERELETVTQVHLQFQRLLNRRLQELEAEHRACFLALPRMARAIAACCHFLELRNPVPEQLEECRARAAEELNALAELLR